MSASVANGSRRGILNPHAGDLHFTLQRYDPAPDLSEIIERYWVVRWDLRGREPYAQETLPYPCVNLVIGTHRPGVHGVATRRFVAELEGEGWVIGAKFRPGGFRPFVSIPMCQLTDRTVRLPDLFGPDGTALECAVHAARTDTGRIALIEAFVRARRPAHDPNTAEAARNVGFAEADPSIARVGGLAGRAGLSVRALQRLFSSYVGIGPKWVIRRFRIHEAANRVANGIDPDWSGLAQELGYFDQAHFIRDFKTQTGRTPADYAALCALAGSQMAT